MPSFFKLFISIFTTTDQSVFTELIIEPVKEG